MLHGRDAGLSPVFTPRSFVCLTAFLLGLGSFRLLDPANTLQFDDFKKCYGEILHRWGLKEKRAEVLKFVSCPPEPHKGIGKLICVDSADKRGGKSSPL